VMAHLVDDLGRRIHQTIQQRVPMIVMASGALR